MPWTSQANFAKQKSIIVPLIHAITTDNALTELPLLHATVPVHLQGKDAKGELGSACTCRAKIMEHAWKVMVQRDTLVCAQVFSQVSHPCNWSWQGNCHLSLDSGR